MRSAGSDEARRRLVRQSAGQRRQDGVDALTILAVPGKASLHRVTDQPWKAHVDQPRGRGRPPIDSREQSIIAKPEDRPGEYAGARPQAQDKRQGGAEGAPLASEELNRQYDRPQVFAQDRVRHGDERIGARPSMSVLPVFAPQLSGRAQGNETAEVGRGANTAEVMFPAKGGVARLMNETKEECAARPRVGSSWSNRTRCQRLRVANTTSRNRRTQEQSARLFQSFDAITITDASPGCRVEAASIPPVESNAPATWGQEVSEGVKKKNRRVGRIFETHRRAASGGGSRRLDPPYTYTHQ